MTVVIKLPIVIEIDKMPRVGARRFELSNKGLRELSAANFEVMKVVWEKGEVTINQVLDTINARRENELKRASVQVMMNRLEKYGWLTHRVEGKTFYYRALQGEKKTMRHIVHDLKTRVFGGSTKELAHYLFENANVSGDELERIAGLLESKKEE
jgi:predicted transcriptional regulator